MSRKYEIYLWCPRLHIESFFFLLLYPFDLGTPTGCASILDAYTVNHSQKRNKRKKRLNPYYIDDKVHRELFLLVFKVQTIWNKGSFLVIAQQ